MGNLRAISLSPLLAHITLHTKVKLNARNAAFLGWISRGVLGLNKPCALENWINFFDLLGDGLRLLHS